MTDAIIGPAGFDAARKSPMEWQARCRGSFWIPFANWKRWTFDELHDPDTEWRRVPEEPMRFVCTQQLSYERDVHSGIVTGNGLLVKVHCLPGSKWEGKRARIVVEEVTGKAAEQSSLPVELDAGRAMHTPTPTPDTASTPIDTTPGREITYAEACALSDRTGVRLQTLGQHPASDCKTEFGVWREEIELQTLGQHPASDWVDVSGPAYMRVCGYRYRIAPAAEPVGTLRELRDAAKEGSGRWESVTTTTRPT